MDDQNAGAERASENLISRPPTQSDLVGLCRELNQRGAKYVVIGGLAIIAAGHPRMTTDVDLMVAADSENEGKVFSALSTLPDNAVRELQPGELQLHNVGVMLHKHRAEQTPWTLCDTGYKEANHARGGREEKRDFKTPLFHPLQIGGKLS